MTRTAEDLTGDGVADLVVAEGRRGDGDVLVYSGADRSLVGRLRPFGRVADQGVRVTLADWDGDGGLDLVTALGPGTRPEVCVWSAAEGELGRFDAFERDFRGGLSLG